MGWFALIRGEVTLFTIFFLLFLMPVCEASEFSQMTCDEWHQFEEWEDTYFLEMLDNLVAVSKITMSGPFVVAQDSGGRFVGSAGCIWHKCQISIYDSDCSICNSISDSAHCIEAVIADMKHGIQRSYQYDDRYCHRSRQFSSGEKRVIVDRMSTAFEICGVQYQHVGGPSAAGRMAAI